MTGKPDLSPRTPVVAVIINAHAGGGHAQTLAQRVSETFRGYGMQADVTLATSGAQLVEAARAAIRTNAAIVVAGGGDGSVNAVASVMIGSDRPFGVLPLGTLNHFAKDLQIPLALEDAIRTIAHGRCIAVDVAEVNGVPFVNNSSLGLYPDIVRAREKQQSRLGRGKWVAFGWAAIAVLRRYPFLDVHLRIDAVEHHRRTPFVFIGNNAYLMHGFDIGTRANLSGGRLCLYVCHRTGRLGLLRLAWHALLGRLHEAHDFDMLDATEIDIDTCHRRAKRLRVATDGEVGILQTPLRYRILPAALRVLVPVANREQ